MSLILVVESESRHAERARDGLGSDGWTVEVVGSCEAAVAAAANRAPQLLLVNSGLAGARELLRNFSRAHGGPGSIALTPELSDERSESAAREADEMLSMPFQEKDLRQLARRVATAARSVRKPEESVDSKRLTSHELFGDLLAEVESEIDLPAPPAPPPSAPAVRAAPAASASSRLEETLSGLAKEEPKRAAASSRKGENIDDMLSRTLSGLDVGKKPAKPPAAVAPRPSPPPPAPVTAKPALQPPVAPVPPAAAPPRPAPAAVVTPPPSAPPPKSATPPPAARLETTPTAKPAAESAAAKRASREIDISRLDELARPRAKESTPPQKSPPAKGKESFATQKISVQPSFLQPPSAEFGQYTLLERIAVGGMAEVWKARMKGVEGFQKTVAIKKILPHLIDSSDFITMFIDEAKLAAQLNHNNIIHIYDLGKINDDYFIAMEFVDGKDLRTILNTARSENRPLSMGLALLVGARLASALEHAHKQKDFEGRALGLVHRDVSPQNVLISYEGDIKLCDFGIVKAVTKASKTQMGALKGKLQYMSPEQAWGRPVDARSDLFSLGSLLFEMLTGRRLFSGESEMSVLDAVREGRIQAPRDLDPRLPLEINALVLKALARDPDDRFQNAGEMQREIDSILSSLKPAPSQGELGAYLQRLFASERSAAAAPATATAGAAGLAAGAAPATASAAVPSKKADVAVVSPTGVSRIEEADAGRGRRMLWLAIGAAAAAGLIAYLALGRGRGTATPPSPEAPPAATATDAPKSAAQAGSAGATPAGATTTANPAGAAPAAGAADNVSQLVTDEVKRREEELKKKYEEELARRRAEIDKLNAKPAAAPAGTSPAPAATEPETAPVPAPEPPPEAAVTEPAPVEDAQTPAPQPAPEAIAEEPAAPRAPVVKEGDLVQPGAGVRPPVLASFTKPEYPPIARRLKVEGTVVLSLLVDETGRVIDTRLESGVEQNVGINEASLAAARSAKFNPATKNGVRVKMWYQLRIPFKL